jgi:protein involved in polysaccharide export with SLBB domain
MTRLFQLVALVSAVAVAGTTSIQATPHATPVEPVEVAPATPLQVTPLKEITVHVIGEVEKPGTFKLKERATLGEALSLAGGPTERANLKDAKVYRGADTLSVDILRLFKEGNGTQNFQLQDGDVMVVPSIRLVAAPRTVIKSEQKPWPEWWSFPFNGITVYLVPIKPQK